MPGRRKVTEIIFGAPLDPFSKETRRHVVLVAFLAWIGLGADGLSSSCYGPEEAFLALGEHRHLGLYLAVATGITVFVIAIAYNQVIELFPSGGGGYKVATNLLGPHAGLVSGAALIVDYMLTIAISVASGVDAVFSLFPARRAVPEARRRDRHGGAAAGAEPARHARVDQGAAADLSRLLFQPCGPDRAGHRPARRSDSGACAEYDQPDRRSDQAVGPDFRRFAVPARILARRRHLYGDRGGLQQRPVAGGAARAHRQVDDVLHGGVAQLHGGRDHPSLPPVGRAARRRRDAQRRHVPRHPGRCHRQPGPRKADALGDFGARGRSPVGRGQHRIPRRPGRARQHGERTPGCRISTATCRAGSSPSAASC